MATYIECGDDAETVTRQTCSICLEIFREPRKLPCHHIFCGVCLHGFLEKCLLSTVTATDVKTFPCPLCRTDIEIKQKDGCQTEDIVKQFDLLSFSDNKNESRSREQATTNCESCLRDDITTPAAKFCKDCNENICNDCIKYHRKNKLLSSHVLKDMVTVNDNVSETLNESQRASLEDNQLKCQRHKLKRFKYICTQHDTLCCSKCVIIDHRQCKDIFQLDEYAESSLFHSEREQLEQNIKNISEKSRHLLVHETIVEKMLNEKKTHLANQFEDSKREVLKVMDEALNEFHTKSLSLISRLVHSSQVNRQRVESLVRELENYEKNLEVSQLDDTERDKKVAALKLINQCMNQPCQVIAECLDEASNNTLECSINTDLLKNTVRNCLKVSVCKIPRFDGARLYSTLDESITCKDWSTDKRSCVRDCVTVDGKICLFTEERNKIIRVFDIAGHKELGFIQLEAEPFGITALDHQTVAVGLPRKNLISVIEIVVTEGKVISKLLRQFKTEYGIYGLNTCTVNDTRVLIALAKETGNFHLYNMDGTEKCVINVQLPEEEKPLRAWNPLSYANYFTVDHQTKQIFISCQKTSKIMCVDFEGNCIFIYKHQVLQTPLVVKIGCNGFLFVCCYGSCRILVLQKVGKRMHVISELPGLRGPVALDFHGDFKHCVVCDDEGEGKFRMMFHRWHVLQGQ